MQRHRAGRLAVLLSLGKIDTKPDGVARTACVQPGAAQVQGNGKTPSTFGLMAPSPSETSMEGSSENLVGSSQNQLVSGGGHGSRSRSDTTKRNQGEEEDGGLKMNIDITQAANVLRLEEEQCSSASDDSGIQNSMREAGAGVGPGPGSKSPSHDDGGGVCAAPPCGVEPNEAACDGSCGKDAAQRTPSAAQLLRGHSYASNDYLCKSSSYVAMCASLFARFVA